MRTALRVFALCVLAACLGTPNATFQITVPTSVSELTAWYEVGVFPNGCPVPDLLLGGIPPEGTIGRLAFAASSQSPPAFGALPTETFGIAAIARAADCSVVGTGCSTVNVSGSSTTLAVSIAAVSGQPAGACETGSVCENAECIPGGDAGVGDGEPPSNVGEACTLELVGQGPLADPLGQASTLLSAPAIAVTPAGFLIAYREFDPTQGVARLTTIAVDASGAAAPPIQTPLLDACTGSPQTDATALSFSGAVGTLALSRPACPDEGMDGGATEGGLILVTLDPTGRVTDSAFTTALGENLTLGQGHALASTPGGLVLAYTDPTIHASFAATVTGTTIASSPPAVELSKLGVTGTASAYVVGTDYGTAVYAIAGSNATVLSAKKGATIAGGTASSFAATWVAAGGSGSRVLVASNGPSTAMSILWSAFDIGTKGASHTGTFAPAGMGNVSFVDVALVGDHAYLAAEVDQSLSLFAFEKASSVPVMQGELDFASYPAIPVGQLTGGLVAVAASDRRIGVVWGTNPSLGQDDDVGGYAVFTCAP